MESSKKEDDDEPSSLSSFECINKKQQRHNKPNSSPYSRTHQVQTPKNNNKLTFVVIFYNTKKQKKNITTHPKPCKVCKENAIRCSTLDQLNLQRNRKHT